MEQSNILSILKDFKVAVDSVFNPVPIVCEFSDSNFSEEKKDEDEIDLLYSPPFFLDSKCNEMFFGVIVSRGDINKGYPLKCTSELTVNKKFVVENSDDWINHVDKFICWKTECQELIRRFRE